MSEERGHLDGYPAPDRSPLTAGHDAWLREVWSENRRWVAAILLAHKPKDADLEDLLQDVAMTLVRRHQDVRDPAKIRPWLRTVAINAARAAGRKRKVRLRLVRPDADVETAPAPERPDPSLLDEARAALDAAHRLHPDYREPLLLRCVRGMSYRRIAQALDLPVTTVETRIARARRMVREELEFAEETVSMRITRDTGQTAGA
ncbi:MAG: sigma-70 family RNA polymerase sigma factor [Phycisphaeraceae bacterium]|nr:sigma-70 family RNA polymerase sigma factor [Phycisphaeraceae bacterium]MCB9847759.1 sigma-70 family RNA polymerase sigma factor [Phycisphaeraceae bacterium]